MRYQDGAGTKQPQCRPHFCVQAFFRAPCSAFGGKKLFVPPYSGALPLFGILAVYLSSDGHSIVLTKHICLVSFIILNIFAYVK